MEKQKIPEVRFKGFNTEWEENILGCVTTFINGRAYSQEELLKKGKYPVVRVGNFNTNSHWYYSDLELGAKYYAEEGDLLYTWSTIFSPYIWKGEKVIYHYHIWKLELSKKLDKLFTFHFLKADESVLTNNTNGSTMIHVTKGEMESKTIHIPLLDEQEKIGLLFESLNTKISLQEKKLTQTQNLKKAMLEKMFPKVGSKQPEIRLKGFDGDWNGLIISDLIEGGIIDKPMDGNHGELHPTSADYIKSGVAFVMANDISNGQLNLKKCKNISYKLSKTLQKGFAVENDVLLTHKATIGETAIVPKLNTPYLVLTPQVTYYRVLNSLKLSNFFLQYSFQASYFKKAMSLAVTGATRLYIGITEQQQLPFLITSFKEQEAIGQFFKQLDETLVLQHQQLQTLKNLKQAFLEKMFV